MEKECVQRKRRGRGLSAALGWFIRIRGGGEGQRPAGTAELSARCHEAAPRHCGVFAFGGENSAHQKGQRLLNRVRIEYGEAEGAVRAPANV